MLLLDAHDAHDTSTRVCSVGTREITEDIYGFLLYKPGPGAGARGRGACVSGAYKLYFGRDLCFVKILYF